MAERRLLVIEDDPGLASQMRWCIDDCDVSVAANAQEAERLLVRNAPQVVTLDLGLPPDPGGTRVGFELLETIARLQPGTKVIVITGRNEREFAVRAIAEGAYDYYQKPIESDTLRFVVERAFRLAELEAENRRLTETASEPLFGFISTSAAMEPLLRRLHRVAPTDATVLITGETGTGKEMVARALHRSSTRADKAFVAINCAAIPENLLESELFGHEKGAFTGAVGRKIGRIESADGGTLFLDEIGDMPPALQAKILRFLQERVITRVGSSGEIPVDVRVLAATHQDLRGMIAENRFRQDLYFRLSEIELALPPLRDRREDILLIAKDLLRRFAPDRSLQFSKAAIAAMDSWDWPGNVRELENRVRRAAILTDGLIVTPADLELTQDSKADDGATLDLKTARARAERQAILQALHRCGNNVSEAARLLGVSRPTLYALFMKHNLTTERE